MSVRLFSDMAFRPPSVKQQKAQFCESALPSATSAAMADAAATHMAASATASSSAAVIFRSGNMSSCHHLGPEHISLISHLRSATLYIGIELHSILAILDMKLGN